MIKTILLSAVFMLGIIASFWQGLLPGNLLPKGILPGSEAATPEVRAASSSEQQAKVDLAGKIGGRVLFDSNRSGSFGVFSIKTDGSDLKVEADTPQHEIYPDASPDGRYVVFNRTDSLDRDAVGNIVLLDRSDSSERIIGQGTFPTFSGDGGSVYYEFSRQKFMKVSLDKGAESVEIFPNGQPDFHGRKVVKPRFSADGNKVYFTSDKGGRWTAWSYDFEKNSALKIGKGCEPVPFEDSEAQAWVSKKGVLSKSGIIKLSKDGQTSVLQDAGEPYGHEYFPTLVESDKFLFYSACPAGQHSHLKANYQLFVRDFSEDKAVRLTFDEFTNRWPKYLPDLK